MTGIFRSRSQVALLGQSFDGNFAWHYPPPFLFVASPAGAFSLCRCVHRLGAGEPRALSRHDARDRRAPVRPVAGGGGADGVQQCAGRPEWLSHRRADRRHALSDAGAADPFRHLPWAAQLQAAIRIAVSAGADRSVAMDGVLHRRDRDIGDGLCIVARLRHRELAGVLPLDADVQPGFPHRRPGAVVEDAQPVRAGAHLRRHRTAGLDIPLDFRGLRSGGAGADVAEPGALLR